MTSPLAGASADARRNAAASLEEIIERLRSLSSNAATVDLLHSLEAERARTLGVVAQAHQDATAVAADDATGAAHDHAQDSTVEQTPTDAADTTQAPLSPAAHTPDEANSTEAACSAAVANPDIVNTDSAAIASDDDDAKKPVCDAKATDGTPNRGVDASALAQAATAIDQQGSGPTDSDNADKPAVAVPLKESDKEAVAQALQPPSDHDYVTLRRFVDLLALMPRSLATKYGATFSLVSLGFHLKTITPWIDFGQHTVATHVRKVGQSSNEEIPSFNVVNISTGGRGDITAGALYDALAPLADANGDAAVCVDTRAMHTRMAVSFEINEAVNYQDTSLNPMRSGGTRATIDDATDLACRCIGAGMSAREVMSMLVRRVPVGAGTLFLVRFGTQLVTATTLHGRLAGRDFTAFSDLRHILADVTLPGADSAHGPAAVYMAETDVSLGDLLRAIDQGADAIAALPRHAEPCSNFWLRVRRLGLL
ncbi:hypothetical protein pdul_cds_597 [Pandoravirus dulcis]|uniref:Uncharacterized protein n=1 Tax=Pandoravirus dulcis TaxID=1349409 RepID=S4VXU3_9VIRU|nr:hypothetical protein pdul_cds_597 [Pandoravirus dulcis]AGO82719.1 hypothetical protein pdul_cds_597 [Pandoravirus dulcis]